MPIFEYRQYLIRCDYCSKECEKISHDPSKILPENWILIEQQNSDGYGFCPIKLNYIIPRQPLVCCDTCSNVKEIVE